MAVIFQLAGGSLLSKQAVLLGAAGLLPSQRTVVGEQGCDGYMAELENLWKRSCEGVMPGKAPDWNLAFVRPVNHPVRRIAALSYLLQRYERSGLLQGLQRLAGNGQAGAAKKLTAGLQVNGYRCGSPQECHCEESNDEAISGHCVTSGQIAAPLGLAKTFTRCHCEERSDEAIQGHYGADGQIAAPFGLAMTMGKAPGVLIGRGRASEIAINVILPFFTAYARQNNDTGLENRVLDTYLRYPTLPHNELTRYMSGVLSGRREGKLSACQQQGLIRLYHRYCRVKDCDYCPVFISRKPARA